MSKNTFEQLDELWAAYRHACKVSQVLCGKVIGANGEAKAAAEAEWMAAIARATAAYDAAVAFEHSNCNR